MLEGAATARLTEINTIMNPDSRLVTLFIVMPPYCSAGFRYPSPCDNAIGVPLCSYPAWLKTTGIHALGASLCWELPNDCPRRRDRFVRSVHGFPAGQNSPWPQQSGL